MKTEPNWISRFAGLASLEADDQAALLQGSRVAVFAAGETVFGPGQSADNLLLLISGTLRVHQSSDTGREVFLYRVHAGESCVLTTACMLSYEDYAATGVAETEVTAAVIPRVVFDDLAGQSAAFRQFVFRAFSRRIADMFSLVDAIVFQRLDVRLAQRLLELADPHGTVRATHQVLGTELGTAREVVSRTLSEFQRRGWISQSRGIVRLVQREGLERLARGSEA